MPRPSSSHRCLASFRKNTGWAHGERSGVYGTRSDRERHNELRTHAKYVTKSRTKLFGSCLVRPNRYAIFVLFVEGEGNARSSVVSASFFFLFWRTRHLLLAIYGVPTILRVCVCVCELNCCRRSSQHLPPLFGSYHTDKMNATGSILGHILSIFCTRNLMGSTPANIFVPTIFLSSSSSSAVYLIFV